MPTETYPRPNDGVPRCKHNRPSDGLIRTNKVRLNGKIKNVPTYWDSACMDEISAMAYTDPHLVLVHSPHGPISWAAHQARADLLISGA